MFYIGQKVVCVDDKPRDFSSSCACGCGVVEGQIYRIADKFEFSDGMAISLHEWPECGECLLHLWQAIRFRPLCDRPTSIEIFKRAPKPAPARIRIETVKERV